MRPTRQLAAIDWNAAASSLMTSGFARLPGLISARDCGALIELYGRSELFRSRIDMAKFRFGRGEYSYFRYPLPPLVEDLRRALYPGLVPIANGWSQSPGFDVFPLTLDELLKLCHSRGQIRPTPLMLRYAEGDYNCLHQDVYGEVTFPLQVVVGLSAPDRDYQGGEFLLVEQHPRAQSLGRAIRLEQGEGLVITTRYRPVAGKRGVYRANVRHGVSPVTAGNRWTLGIIFHDSK